VKSWKERMGRMPAASFKISTQNLSQKAGSSKIPVRSENPILGRAETG